VLSGYLGSAAIGEAILDAVAEVKQANPAAQYCCDPVIGDAGRGVFVQAGIPEFMRDRAVPAADIVTPNQFELEQLTGRSTATAAEMLAAVDALHALGPRIVLVTSVHTQETPADAIDILASDRECCFRARTPRLPVTVNGAGDAIAALFVGHFLRDGVVREALARAVSAIFGILRATVEAGSREILLIDAQEEIVAPSLLVDCEDIRQ
jgi:pyridoxine kinase